MTPEQAAALLESFDAIAASLRWIHIWLMFVTGLVVSLFIDMFVRLAWRVRVDYKRYQEGKRARRRPRIRRRRDRFDPKGR